jgi:phosphohistidine phosphatase
MRTLYLLRHAKASSGEEGGRDFDRTLETQGRGAAAKVGFVLASEKLTNPLFLSSPAVRARQTTEIVLNRLPPQQVAHFDSRIYEANLSSLLTTLSEINDETEVVVLVGHNPGLENLLRFLTGEIRGVTTAGLAKILLSSKSWRDLNQGEGTLSWVSFIDH